MQAACSIQSRRSYEQWHTRLPVDRQADAPWHRLLFKHLSPERDLLSRRVLEVACGRGGLACRLAVSAHPGSRIVAVDFSSVAVSKGRGLAVEQGLGRIAWEVGDLQALGHRDAVFDTVISCETIEHLLSPRAALEEMARVLKPRGRLFLTTPNYLGPMGLYRGVVRLRGRRYSEEGQPINHFMLLPVTLLWLRRAGLRITTVDATGHYIPWPRRVPIRVSRLELKALRWFALHSLIIAEKP